MNGKILVDMTVDDRPLSGSSKFLLKRWTEHTIYAKSGSYNRTDNPKYNFYSTSSVYLYDYIVVSEKYFSDIVYTASYSNFDPGEVGAHFPANKWVHNANTFKQTPNLTTNNYVLTSSKTNGVDPSDPSFQFIYDTYVRVDNGAYFELVKGYPRNHFTHKRDLFSLYNVENYVRNRQTVSTTIGEDGLEDGSSPVQTTQVGNVNLVQTTNVVNY